MRGAWRHIVTDGSACCAVTDGSACCAVTEACACCGLTEACACCAVTDGSACCALYARAYTKVCASCCHLSPPQGDLRAALMGARFSKPRALHGIHACVAHGGHVSDVTLYTALRVTGDSNLHKLWCITRACVKRVAEFMHRNTRKEEL